jgi:SAM-dependent methyltransferase
VDLSADAIRYLRNAGSLPVARASVEGLPFRDGAFDAVASLDVLYIEGVDDRRALREFFRVLRPGGVLALNLPAFEFMRSAHDRAIHTRRRYRRPEVVELLREAGFTVLKATYWNALLFPLICLIRLARSRSAGEEVASDVRKTPGLINALLMTLLRAENRWVALSSFPVGTSVFCVGRKEP